MHEIHLGTLGMVGVTWGTFLLAATLSFGFQVYRATGTLSPVKFFHFAFPASGWLTKSARTDVAMYVISKFLKVLDFAGKLALGNGVFQILQWVHPLHAHAEVSILAIVLWSLLFFVVVDFSNYLTHFLQHFVPVLWELHKVHHSATFLNPLTTKRMHPLGDMFDGVVAALLLAVPFGVCQYVTGLDLIHIGIMMGNANLIGTIIVLDSLRHSHLPVSMGALDRVFISPHMHQLHHSYRPQHWDKTFGNKLSIWDWAFSTMYRPAEGEDIGLGLGKAEDDDYHSLWGVYAGPLIKVARLVRGEPSYQYAGQVAAPPAPFFERVLWRKPAPLEKQTFVPAPNPFLTQAGLLAAAA